MHALNHRELAALAMVAAWVLMVLVQVAFARHERASRSLIWAAWLLMPIVVAAALIYTHYRLRAGADRELAYFFAVQAALLAQFLVSFFVAMLNRATPEVHSRLMACSALALVGPILERLLVVYLGIPSPQSQFIVFGVVDAILVLLVVRDRMQGAYTQAYEGMLAVFVATQVPTFFATGSKWWMGVTQAFARLPLP